MAPETMEEEEPNNMSAFFMSVAHDHGMALKSSEDYMDGYQEKLKKLKVALWNARDSSECLIMIDGLQRLAIDYHFEEEIEAILGRINRSIAESDGVYDDNDLYYVSLRFRLLRQNGYHPSADVFNKFKDENGTFKLSLRENHRGIMELFEASELRIEGEIILDEASVFASKHLNDVLKHVGEDEARVIRDTLNHPFNKSLARFKAKPYIKNFERDYGTNDILQELVKVDFNIVQTLHQKELLEVSMWWKDLGLTRELKFARNQPVKWYLWSIATLSDPRYSKERIELTKPISLIYIMDDIFDVHGTFDELVLFTEAINIWDLSAMEKLPHYMKVFYKVIYDITDDISSKVFEEHGCNPSDSLRKAWGKLCDAFLMEAKWFTSGKVPEAEEYLKNGVISTGVHVVFVHIYFLLGQGITKESVDLIDNIPGLVTYPATILRLWDDLGSAMDEKQDGHDGSYINCYLKENRSSTVESARKHVFCMISDAWKRLNKECLSSTPFSSSFVKASINAARMVSLMYSYDDNHQLPNLVEHIKSLLYENITL
ncbi:hypothetical protein GIB67_003764 [Kingdonia uniflora]|uniref:Uncharacterized protein n=1 Tax=Kingdonia uniflora TaxID=39325 RepID=A0A7J7PA64_9MAGN|nr:hypothetical protein GIB67_003764 [Kingdonia uniflora]